MLNNVIALLNGGGAGGGGSSFESIATATGTGSSGTITFSSIPQTYQHLQIRMMVRNTAAGGGDYGPNIRFNDDNTNANYTYHSLQGNGTSATASGSTSWGYITPYYGGVGSTAGTNTMGVAIVDIHDYTSTTKNKTCRTFNGANNNDTTTTYAVQLSSGLWLSTAAITKIVITASGTNFTTASTFALYGIKGS